MDSFTIFFCLILLKRSFHFKHYLFDLFSIHMFFLLPVSVLHISVLPIFYVYLFSVLSIFHFSSFSEYLFSVFPVLCFTHFYSIRSLFHGVLSYKFLFFFILEFFPSSFSNFYSFPFNIFC